MGVDHTVGFYNTTWVLYHTAAKQVWHVPVPTMGTVIVGTGMEFLACELPMLNPMVHV